MILLINVITLYRLPPFFLAYRGIPAQVFILYGCIVFITIATWGIRKYFHISSDKSLYTIGVALALIGFTASLFSARIPMLALSLLSVGMSAGLSIYIKS